MIEQKRIKIKYGIGYGTHETEIWVEDGLSEDEIQDMAYEAIQERLWVSATVVDDEGGEA
mgnify:CR=1 FL=1